MPILALLMLHLFGVLSFLSGDNGSGSGDSGNGGGQGDPPGDGDNGDDGGEEDDEADTSKLKALVKKLRGEVRTATRELKPLKQFKESAEEQRRKAEEAGLSEVEKLKKQLADLEPKVAAATTRERDYTLRDAIGETVGTKDFPATLAPGVSAAKVLRLMDAEKVEWSDAGQPTNVRALLAGLAKSDPYLFARQRVPSADGGAGGAGNAPMGVNQMIRQMAGRG